MGVWVDSVEARARIIHGQAAAARALASRNHADPDEFTRPYLDLLNRLYREEFPFAQLVDSSDPRDNEGLRVLTEGGRWA